MQNNKLISNLEMTNKYLKELNVNFIFNLIEKNIQMMMIIKIIKVNKIIIVTFYTNLVTIFKLLILNSN